MGVATELANSCNIYILVGGMTSLIGSCNFCGLATAWVLGGFSFGLQAGRKWTVTSEASRATVEMVGE